MLFFYAGGIINNIQTIAKYNMQSEGIIIGYMHVILQSVTISFINQKVHAKISIDQVSKIQSSEKRSGAIFNESFLLQIPKDPSKLNILCYEGQSKVAQCKYDITQFLGQQGIGNTLESNLVDEQNNKCGIIKIKLTYFSSKYGKLRIRIFELYFHPGMVKQYKQAKIKIRFGVFSQNTPIKPLNQAFDQTLQLIILKPTLSLSFDVIYTANQTQHILASATIKNAQQTGMISQQSKAYQLNLVNKDKAIGMIKYQVSWSKR